MDEQIEDVRIVRGDPNVEYLEPRRQRTEAQRAQDEILDKAAAHAEEALEHVNKALDWLSVVTQPKNRTVPVYVRQLIEEIAETKRLKQ